MTTNQPINILIEILKPIFIGNEKPKENDGSFPLYNNFKISAPGIYVNSINPHICRIKGILKPIISINTEKLKHKRRQKYIIANLLNFR